MAFPSARPHPTPSPQKSHPIQHVLACSADYYSPKSKATQFLRRQGRHCECVSLIVTFVLTFVLSTFSAMWYAPHLSSVCYDTITWLLKTVSQLGNVTPHPLAFLGEATQVFHGKQIRFGTISIVPNTKQSRKKNKKTNKQKTNKQTNNNNNKTKTKKESKGNISFSKVLSIIYTKQSGRMQGLSKIALKGRGGDGSSETCNQELTWRRPTFDVVLL